MGFIFFLRASKQIMSLDRASESNVMAVRICMGIPFQLLIAMIYYGTQSDIRVKTFSSRNSPESSMLNFEHRDRLLAIRRSDGKVMIVCICDGLHFYPKCVSTNYELRSGVRVKRYGHPNMRGHSISTFNCHDILRDSIGHPSQNFRQSEFTRVFHVKF